MGSPASTAVFGNAFYVEQSDQSSGIRVHMPGHGLTVDAEVALTGRVRTARTGERYIEAWSASALGPMSVGPLGLNARALGGGDWQYDPAAGAGQQGIAGAYGLNNIGLLVRAWGRVTSTAADYFTIDDGSSVNVKCVVPAGVILPDQDDYVSVTGISSCEKVGDDLHRLVRVRDQSDILPL